ncbi:hypothetical protein GCM10017620_13010 [Brevundimonas intermedia]|uniref:Tetratricopeptide repeat protein n=1 Tax=Brevundimonas intermedia TaxID=74315 RepID=A0ABQ5TAF0_9CAUL|nr:hypothetical protein [Brevundimonas intermedia]GLK48328.1 hypothetical protein GCM10017620_13010 [Brevundimonas intermedia]
MTLRSRSLFLALGLSLGGAVAAPVTAQTASPAGEVSTLSTQNSADARPMIDVVLSGARLDFAMADRLYARAVLANDLSGVYGRLDELAVGADPEHACRIAVLKAVLEWRDGDVDAATDTVSAALDRCQSTDALLLRGRLLDIQNQAGAASVWYERARAQSGDAEERALLDRRLAIIGAMGRKPDALAQLAGSGDVVMANRAAAVLGLLGRPSDAAALYRPRTEAGARYSDAVRLADWAIGQGSPDAAAASAWRAVEAAGTTEDRRYALALLVEAYRTADQLTGAERFLAEKPRGPDVDQARLDVLLELRRYDDAVAMVQQTGDPALRERLLSVLKTAGRAAEVEAEYRRLIRARPDDSRWADGLAALYLEQGKADEAVEVYRGLAVANRADPDVQIETARKMIGMGMGEQASRILGDAGSSPAVTAAIRRFEVETAIDQGREAEAEAGLRALSAAAPRDTAVLVAVAEDYERLGRQDLALETLLGVESRGGVLDDDQQAHIADLAFAAGKPAEALARWRVLWARTQLPARKVFLQRQIIRAAQQTGQLEPIAAELEGRITSGAADQGEVSLLVEIRIAQQDGAGAELAVRRYAERSRSGEVRTLEQLAAVQARLRNYPGLNASLARLAQVDPANADAYLRRLIINVLRFPDAAESEADRNRRIDDLMAQMRAAGKLDDVEAARFAASIYTSGYRRAEALSEHRRALALAPADVDALLEYTAALKAEGWVAQAAGLLQFKAETAPSGAAFVAALNGLLDGLAAGDANSDPVPTDLSQARLGWARRAALERILQDGDDVRLSSLVGDIGQERGDPELQLRALQSSLAVAGDQKPAVLRQLISLTSASETAVGDPARKAIYGRRLVAMRKPYPPEVYADLAQTFLKAGDVAGAERAFGLMGDIGGLVNVDALRGEAYAEAGLTREALASYRVALLQDQDNLDLIARTAVLLEQSGQTSEASALYWRGLNALVQRQPSQRAGDALKALDAAQYAPTLIEGALLTWPAGETPARLAAWRGTASSAALRPQTAPGGSAKLAAYPRLALIARINQRLATFLGDADLDELQTSLLTPFADDPEARGVLADLPGPVAQASTATSRDWPIADLRRQAEANGDFDLGLTLAFEAGDRARIRTLTDQAIAADAPWRVERERGVTENQPPMLVSLLLKAADVDRPEIVREDILAPLARTPFNDLALYDVYRIDPARFAKLEAVAGRRLLSDDVLIPLLVSRGNDPLPVAGAAGRTRGGPTPLQVMTQRFDPDRLIDLYEALVERLEQTGSASGLQDAIADHLLDAEINAAQRARLQAVLIRDIGAERSEAPNTGAGFAALLLRLDAPTANRDVLIAGARALAARHVDSARLPEVLTAWFAGDRARAFDALTAVIEAMDTPPLSLTTLLTQRFEAERQAAFDAFLATPRPTREETARFQTRFLRGEATKTPVDAKVAAAYARLVSIEPGNGVYVAGLILIQAKAEDFSALVASAAPYAATRSDDQVLGTVLGLAYRLTDNAEGAARIAESASVDLDDPEWIGQLASRAAEPRSGEFDLLSAFEPVWSAYRQRFPQAPAVVGLAVQEPEWTPAAADRPLDRLIAPQMQGAARADALRGLWRSTAPRGREDGDTADRQALIDSLADPAAAGYGASVVAAVTNDPAVTAELESELSSLSAIMQARQMRLYDRVAQGLWTQGAGRARLDALAERLSGPPIGVDDLALFLALENRAPEALDSGRLVGLTRQLRFVATPSAGLRLAAARAYGRAGESAIASALIQAALLQSLYPTSRDYADPGDPPLDADAFSQALAAFSDPPAADRIRKDLAALLRRQAASSVSNRFTDLVAGD